MCRPPWVGVAIFCNKSPRRGNLPINKWMKKYVENGCEIHSFRHSMRDRLREVEWPSDIVDQIGGWTRSTVGQSYGAIYLLPVLHKWFQMIE